MTDGTAERAELRARALELFRRGEGDCGLALAREIEDWDLCARIANRWHFTMRFRGFHELYLSVIDDLPPSVAERYGSIWSTRRFYDGRFDGLADDSPLWQPRVPPTAPADQRSEALAESLTLQAIVRAAGRLQQAARLVSNWYPVAEVHRRGRARRGLDITAVWVLHAGIAHELAGQRELARQRYADAWRQREHDESGVVAIDAPAKLAAHDAMRGHHADAARWLERVPLDVTDVTSEGGLASFVKRSCDTARIAIALDRLRIDRARAIVADRDQFGDRDEFWFYPLILRCELHLTAGDPLEALSEYDAAMVEPLNVLSPEGVAAPMTTALRASILLALGRLTLAANTLETMRDDDPYAAAHRVRLLLITGSPEAALALAQSFIGQHPDLLRIGRELHLLAAVAAEQCGRGEQALAFVRPAVRNAVRHGDLRVLLTAPRAPLDALALRCPELAEVLVEVDAAGLGPIYPDIGEVVRLSERERVVLQVVAREPRWSTAEVARSLVVSENTVKSQMRSLFRKLGVSTRTELLAAAARQGFISDLSGPAER